MQSTRNIILRVSNPQGTTMATAAPISTPQGAINLNVRQREDVASTAAHDAADEKPTANNGQTAPKKIKLNIRHPQSSPTSSAPASLATTNTYSLSTSLTYSTQRGPAMFSQDTTTVTDEKLHDAVRRYVAEHGFGERTPTLSRQLRPEVFKQHYYDKKTLMEFCRSHNIPTVGLKNELNDRIEQYLRTGKVPHVAVVKKSGQKDSERGLKLDLPVVNYTSDPATRSFMQRHIPGFTGFSAAVQKWIKESLAEGEELTYQDIIDQHKQYLKTKTLGGDRKVAHDSCQFNQFYIDYSRSSRTNPHTAKQAWELVRDSAGDKTYARYHTEIEKIIKILREQKTQDISNKTSAGPKPLK